jgi:cell shape-determining protein MreD
MKLLAVLLLSVALILQASLTTIPFIFLILLVFTVLLRANWLFVLAFIFGIFLDLVTFKVLGTSSASFLVILFLVLLYRSKFEIATNTFIVVVSFLGSLGYLFLLGYHDNLLLQAVVSSIIGLIMFKLIQRSNKTPVITD